MNQAEPLIPSGRNSGLPDHQIVLFIIYDHEEQRRPFQEYLSRLLPMNAGSYPDGVREVNFLRVENAAEEEEAIRLIRHIRDWVGFLGIRLTVMDLRGDKAMGPDILGTPHPLAWPVP